LETVDNRTWETRTPLRVARGQRVIIEMVNRSTMAHPMHLHGHHITPVVAQR
jgi:FtsP/CotA-like multicopper oxidase with cupredoxin domain